MSVEPGWGNDTPARVCRSKFPLPRAFAFDRGGRPIASCPWVAVPTAGLMNRHYQVWAEIDVMAPLSTAEALDVAAASFAFASLAAFATFAVFATLAALGLSAPRAATTLARRAKRFAKGVAALHVVVGRRRYLA